MIKVINHHHLAPRKQLLITELRVFIPEFMDRRRIHSELNLDINREFADAGIEIPFPQSDLHLRSVDAEAAKLFTSEKTPT